MIENIAFGDRLIYTTIKNRFIYSKNQMIFLNVSLELLSMDSAANAKKFAENRTKIFKPHYENTSI